MDSDYLRRLKNLQNEIEELIKDFTEEYGGKIEVNTQNINCSSIGDLTKQYNVNVKLQHIIENN